MDGQPGIGHACATPAVSADADGGNVMHLIRATFVDHDEAMLAIEELREELGVTDVAVAPLAEVDPPLAEPLLVAAQVTDEDEPAARGMLRSRGAAIVSLPAPAH
jgi:hypothetical protein